MTEDAVNIAVLYQDDALVVIYKPAGMLVHRSPLAARETLVVMTLLRDQLGQWVYPVHRLDRPTEGVMVFALSAIHARALCAAFADRRVSKHYLAVVRGHLSTERLIERPLREEDGQRPKAACPEMPASTQVRPLATTTLDVEIDRYPTSRYTLVDVQPLTGRRHQIRRHLSGIGHPIIGDAKHGKSVHNRYFKQHYFAHSPGEVRLLLASYRLSLPHPVLSNLTLTVTAPLTDDFTQLLTRLGWQNLKPHATITLC